VNSLPKAVTRQRRDCDLNPDPSVPESSTLTTRLPSHPLFMIVRPTYNDDDAESEVSDTCVRNSLLSCRVISLEGHGLKTGGRKNSPESGQWHIIVHDEQLLTYSGTLSEVREVRREVRRNHSQ